MFNRCTFVGLNKATSAWDFDTTSLCIVFLFYIFSIRVKSLRLPTSELTRRFSGLEVALEKIIFNIGKSRSRMTSGEFDLDSSFVNIFGIEKLFMNVDFFLFGRNLGESTLVRFFAHWFFVAFFIEFLDSFNEANKSKKSPPRPLGSAYFKPVVPSSSSDEGYFDFIHFLSHTSGLGLIF